jgi:hypothetical protein
MITEIQGDTNLFRAKAYGVPDMVTIDWCRQREASYIQMLDPSIRQVYMDNQNTVFGAIDFEGISNTANAMRNHENSIWLSNSIIPLYTIEQCQLAPPVMIPWIMANPVIRQAYHDQRIAGYDEYYTDPEPNKDGEDHYYYRRVMDGMVVEDQVDHFVAIEWFEDLADRSDELSFIYQRNILSTWERMVEMINSGDRDPTSRFNAQL